MDLSNHSRLRAAVVIPETTITEIVQGESATRILCQSQREDREIKEGTRPMQAIAWANNVSSA